MKPVVFVAALAVHAVIGQQAAADPARSVRPAPAGPAFMRVYGTSPPPFGFVQFCERVPTECVAAGRNEPRFEATPERLSELDEINRQVNAEVIPATDLEIYGINEYWALPGERGDCEDYALLKRQMLMKRGWPSSALLLTVVRDERGDGHAVLTARTAQGDLILDNKISDIRPWHQTGYRYVMRQSFVEPKLWMSLMPAPMDRADALASTRARR